MRCSSCEPLLDAFIERALPPLSTRRVTQHVRQCRDCAALLEELRVVDALLATARPRAAMPPGFTHAVMAATRTRQRSVAKPIPLWAPLAGYLALAWALFAIGALAYRPTAALERLAGWEHRAAAATAAAGHTLAPLTPLAALTVTSILALDLLLMGAIFFGYRRLRPALALHLARRSKAA